MLKELFAKLMLKIIPEKPVVIDPYRPQEPGESTEEYHARVPLMKRYPPEPSGLSYLGKPIIKDK